eukprot:34247-Eustigmatos_ZCMA.PRE.1
MRCVYACVRVNCEACRALTSLDRVFPGQRSNEFNLTAHRADATTHARRLFIRRHSIRLLLPPPLHTPDTLTAHNTHTYSTTYTHIQTHTYSTLIHT